MPTILQDARVNRIRTVLRHSALRTRIPRQDDRVMTGSRLADGGLRGGRAHHAEGAGLASRECCFWVPTFEVLRPGAMARAQHGITNAPRKADEAGEGFPAPP